VVRYGGESAVSAASIRTQAIFQDFEILQLNESIRQRTDPVFSQFLDGIGDRVGGSTVDLACLPHTFSTTEFIEFVFPKDVVSDPTQTIHRAILSPYNVFVDEFNAGVLALVDGDARSYHSSDTVVDDDPENPCTSLDFLNSLTEPGIPPHELQLKVGAVCRFTRNFDAGKGLTKNTRVVIRRLMQHSVEVETFAETVAGKITRAVRHNLLPFNKYH